MLVYRLATISLCCAVMVFGGCVAPDDVETRSEALTEDELRAGDLIAELLAAQRPQPITEEFALDPESEIRYSCENDLSVLATSAGCEVDPDSARCASIAVGEATLTLDDSSSKSCTTRIHCSTGTVSVCRTCKTCCDLRNGSTTCTTTCGPGRYIIWME